MPMTPNLDQEDRIIFLDNLRYLMVLLVVILHAAISYSNFVPWWCVKEGSEFAVGFDILLIFLDVFLMPILFFIAGFFTMSSFQRKGALSFLRSKLKRLGLPLLIGVPLTSPLFYYIYHHTRYGTPRYMTLKDVWLNYLKKAGDLQIGLIQSIEQFSQSHLWFMSLLLFFFIIFSILCGIRKRIKTAASGASLQGDSSKKVLLIFCSVGLLSAVSMFIASAIFADSSNPNPWITIANIIQFEAEVMVTYVLYFSLGVYASYKKWFTNANFPGRPIMWAITSVFLFLSLLVVFKQMLLHLSPGLIFIYFFTRSFLCISLLAGFTSCAINYWNRPSKVNRLLAMNSYHIYIVHFIVVILIQWILAGWSDGPVLVKFGIVSVGSIATSYGISNFAIRPHPRLSVIGIYAVLVILMLTIRPPAS